MEIALSLLPILAVLTIGVVSPGPSFILVAQTAVSLSRTHAIAAAIGMASGATLLSIAALLGLHVLLSQIPTAFLFLKALAGIYLLYLGVKSWRCADRPMPTPASNNRPERRLATQFLQAAAVMVTNPKAAVQYGVIFAAMLPSRPTPALFVALPIAVFSLEASWYVVVAIGLSAQRPRAIYLSVKRKIDRTAGVVLGLLGAKLIFSAK